MTNELTSFEPTTELNVTPMEVATDVEQIDISELQSIIGGAGGGGTGDPTGGHTSDW